MKQKIILPVCALLLLCCAAQSQLVYDFSKGDFKANDAYDAQKKRIKAARNGQPLFFHIININTFRYKVDLQGVSVNYVTPVPSELQTVFRLNAENIDDKNIVNALRITKSASDEMQEEADNTKKIEPDNAGSVSDAETKVEEAEKANTLAAVGTPAAKAAAANLAKAKEKLEETKVASKAASEKLNKAMTKLAKACSVYVEVAKKVANIKFRRMQLIDLSKQKWKDHSQLNASLPARMSESQMKKDYDLFTEYYATAYALYSSAGNAAAEAAALKVPGAAAIQKSVAKAEEEIEEGHNLFYQDNFIKLISDVGVLQTALEKPEYFKVESAPIQVDGDLVRFDVKIEPSQINDLMPYEFTKEFPIEVPTKFGLKVDFGVGPAFSFGSDSKDDVYYFEPTTGDKGILRKRDNNNVITPSIGAFMAVGPRFGRDFRIGGLFGVGAGFQSAKNVNFNMYMGVSAVFGKRERIMLGLGQSYLRVARIKDKEFETGKEYTIGADITERVYKPSWFATLTYNITNRIEVR